MLGIPRSCTYLQLFSETMEFFTILSWDYHIPISTNMRILRNSSTYMILRLSQHPESLGWRHLWPKSVCFGRLKVWLTLRSMLIHVWELLLKFIFNPSIQWLLGLKIKSILCLLLTLCFLLPSCVSALEVDILLVLLWRMKKWISELSVHIWCLEYTQSSWAYGRWKSVDSAQHSV